MKTILLTAATLISACVAMAQTPTPYYTGFDNTTQQAGWQKYRQGTLHLYQWEFGPAIGTASPPYCAWHNYPSGGVPVPVVDWLVSPMFNFTGGGKIDSVKVSVYSASGVASPNDFFGIYLLNGSADPAIATTTLLADLTNMITISQLYKDTFNIIIPATGGNCYIGFKYSCQNNSLITRFDNLKIVAASGCVAPSAVNATPAESSVNINWTAVPGVAGYNYVLNNTPADPVIIGNTTATPSFSTTGLSHSTTYYFHVRSACGGNFNSAWKTQAFTTTTPGTACEQPAAINISNLTDTGVKLSWDNINSSKGYEYMVNESPDFPTTSGSTANVTYTELNQLKPGTVYYAYLRTRCAGTAGFVFSPWIGRQFFTQFATGINNNAVTGSALHIFPNPVAGLLTIQGTRAGNKLAITGMNGKVIETFTCSANLTYIDMTSYPPGIYLLNCNTGTETVHLKITRQ